MLEVYTKEEFQNKENVVGFVTQFIYVMNRTIYVYLYAEKDKDDFLRVLQYYAKHNEFIDRYNKFRPEVVEQLVCIYTAKNCI